MAESNGNMQPPVNISPSSSAYTVADAFLEALANAGVDYLFTVLGSDHPSLIEAYVRRQHEHRQKYPEMLLFLHEYVAISAADAYGRATGKPQCVIVHVDVGTAALGQGLHNASSGKAPVLIFSGIAPFTLLGELPGSRSEHVQWYQDVPNQAAMLAPYSRYTNEIKSGEHVGTMVYRAIMMASTFSPGPTYLTASRETLAARANPPAKGPLHTCRLGSVPPDAVVMIGDALMAAETPLIVTGYLGRSHDAVKYLIKLADLVGGLKVFDSEMREMSFPADHPAVVFRSTGAGPAIKTADVILVLDADVPWIPTKIKPEYAKIFHIDLDPRKEKMNLFDLSAHATYAADSNLALQQLCEYVRKHDLTHLESKRSALKKAHEDGAALLQKQALPSSDGSLTKSFLFRKTRETLPRDAIFVSDAVTNQSPMMEQLQLTDPASNFTKGASGLGWAGGAAIGIGLATKMYDLASRPNINRQESKGRFVCSFIGDGSFMFSVPGAVYWASHRHKCPFLTIVINNGGWKATRSCINDVHPGGLASNTTDEGLGIDLRMEGPDYCGIAKAAANGNLFTARVEKAAELEDVLKRAVMAVEEGIGAIVDAVIID